jgi:DNA polymerase I-like protein with 3'-5' exonuclease and polymerase domains
MNVITIDFETYYSQQFSLSKVTTEEYIRSSRFETIGIAVKVNDEETQWFSGTKLKIKKWLSQFPWDDAITVAHNAMFDMAILSWVFDIHPVRIADTLSMLRAIDGPDAGNSLAKAVERYGLGEKGTEVINALGKRRLDFTPDELKRYGEYCINDVELTHKLFHVLLETGFPMIELKLIDLTINMFTEPVLTLDKQVLTNHLSIVRNAKDDLLSKAMIGKDQLMSNGQLAELLRGIGVEPPTKISAKTGKEAFAFAKSDEAFKELLEHENPVVQAIVAARLGVKSTLEESRTERFIQIAERGALPVPLRYYAAHTGRWGGDDKVNLQNLPRKSELKKSMLAPEGYMFIDCDSSQIEARTLAWLAGQHDLVAAFDAGEDVYKIMASSIYGVPIDEVTDPQRFVGKTTILGAGYGMGAAKFQAQLKTFGVTMELDECKYIIRPTR